MYLARVIVLRGCAGRPEYRSSSQTVLPDFVIWMLYNKALHWLTFLYVPYFALITPILDYFSFRGFYFAFRKFYSAGDSASSDIGFFLMIMMNLTLLYC